MSFSFVIIPDTQIISRDHPEAFTRMTRWIVDQAESLRIRAVLHLGDVVDSGDRSEEEWILAREAMSLIEQSGIPLMIAPGNHDYDNLLETDRSLTVFNRYFGLHRFDNQSWFVDAFEEGQAENVYACMEIDGMKFLFLTLEFGPRDEVLAWVDEILLQYQDHMAVIITHCYMFIRGERNRPGDAHNPKTYLGAIGANDGEDLWQKCFRKHRNVIGIYSGHQVPSHISYRMDEGKQGNLVFQSFQNWQNAPNGGEGRIRIVSFCPVNNVVQHRVFNPQTNRYETEEGYEISIPIPSMEFPDSGDWASVRYPK